MKRLILTCLAALVSGSVMAETQYIVQLKPGADPAAVATRAGVVLRSFTPNAPFALYAVTTGAARAAAARLRADRTSVLWVEDNNDAHNPESEAKSKVIRKGSGLSVIGDRKDLIKANTDALKQVDWSSALAESTTGRVVKLAILDNGLSRNQKGLWSKVDASFDAFGGDADDKPMLIDSNKDGEFDVAVGHGTMVAGIADTVAPNVRLVIAKIADSDGHATAWSVIQGLAFAVNSGAEVANLSMGSPTAVAAFTDVADWCDSKGLLVVAAAGNAAEAKAWFPARASSSLCVSGVNADSTKADFSNYERTVDASAPAVGLTSQWWDGGLATWTGTSFAAPFVSASLADCLRRTKPFAPGLLVRKVTLSGLPIDTMNPLYKGRLGKLLDFAALNKILAARR
jgi:hypothetical protein